MLQLDKAGGRGSQRGKAGRSAPDGRARLGAGRSTKGPDVVPGPRGTAVRPQTGGRGPAPSQRGRAQVRRGDGDSPPPTGHGDPVRCAQSTAAALGYELVDVERAARGLLRVTIDRLPGRAYPGDAGPAGDGSERGSITVEDCEAVTRQLQYALEVEGVDYARLEVSSPGLDRPLRSASDFQRFEGAMVALTLKEPFEGRKAWKGVLGRAAEGWTLTFEEARSSRQLSFALDEVRDARLVPVLDFKGRRGSGGTAGPRAAADADGGQDR